MSTTLAVFYLLAGLTVGSAIAVAVSRHVVYAAFALMSTLLGVAGLFVLLSADFLAVVQLLVYVGGVLVLGLFAIMLTHRIAEAEVSNRAVGRGPAAVVVGLVLAALLRALGQTEWGTAELPPPAPTTYAVGMAFLGDYALPFEVASLVLLLALVGAVVVSRKELGR
ncbi:MAG: NADH-quinone oxidoreductase subunit J [bacterium]|nr:NADH-quinone oxidoreductase subunit J [bacterium]